MSPRYRFWILAYPDLKNAVGGIKQLHRVAEILETLGYSACLVQESVDFHPSWFESQVNTISRLEWISRKDFNPFLDLIILPETFVPLISSLFPDIPKIIFNQNAAYTFGLPSQTLYKPSAICDLYHFKSVVQVWCVSQADYDFLARGLDIQVSRLHRIVNTIDFSDSALSGTKVKQISYMSRKNALDSACVLSMLRQSKWLQGWQFVEIKNTPHSQVLSILNQSLFFLSFGHPEGFGLPVAEALASKCAVVGYDGIGGRELFQISNNYGMSHVVPFGDWLGFVDGIHKLYSSYKLHPELFVSRLETMSAVIRDRYSLPQMIASIKSAVDSLSIG